MSKFFFTHMANYTRTWNRAQLKSKLQHDRNWWAAKRPLAAPPAAYVITQQYSSTTFASLRFHCRKRQSVLNAAMLYYLFCVFPQRLKFMCRHFGTLCSIFIGGVIHMEQTVCSELSADKIQAPGKHPKERIQHSVQGESLNQEVLLSSLYFFNNSASLKLRKSGCVRIKCKR